MNEACNMHQDKYPELLTDLRDKAEEALIELGMTVELAKKAAYVVSEIIRKDWSGQQHYIPKGLAYDITVRDWEIWEKFDGTTDSIKKLVKEYDLTEQRLYKIIKAIRPLAMKRHQPDLFE